MFTARTVLHPTNFSDCSRCAFQVAATLAREQGGHLIVLHVNQTLGPTVAFGEALADLRPQEYKDWLWKVLRRFQVPDPQVTVEHRMEEGDPAQVILRTAAETDSDLIVMGTHGRARLEQLVLGSVAEQVLRQASCPVVTVKRPQGTACVGGSRNAGPAPAEAEAAGSQICI
jgi:nucleotide-binding universal stress UspA family protein